MNSAKKRLSAGFVLLFFATVCLGQNWQQLPDFPSAARDDGARFVINKKAYCGTGYLPWFAASADFHVFDAATQSWTTAAPLPTNQERQYAVGFASDSLGYIFGGLRDGEYLNDLWRYNPTQNTWSAGTPLPDSGRSGAAVFVIEQTAYIIGGQTKNQSASADVWAYNFVTQNWAQKNDFPFGEVWRGSATSLDSTGYLLFGKDANDSFAHTLYQYNPSADSWSFVTNFPEIGRAYSALEANENHLLVFGGMDSANHFYNNFWRFDLANNLWQPLPDLPAANRRGGMSFLVDNNFYYTTGLDSTGTRLTETWACQNAISVVENEADFSVKIYPNPTQKWLQANFGENYFDVKIYTLLGKLLFETHEKTQLLKLDVSTFKAGNYILQIENSSGAHSVIWEKI